MLRVFSTALLMALLPAPAEAAGPPPAEPDRRLQAVRLLHEGRFDEADEVLAESGGRGGEPSTAFVRAFVTYWRLLYDQRDPALRKQFEERLGESVRLAEARLEAVPGDPEATLWAGTSRLLRAQLRAVEKKALAAAFEAKRAKRFLDQALQSRAWSSEAAFSLGTYLYMADRVPAFVKGVRALLFLPGGNRERGLDLLRRAAGESRLFALDARLLLMTIYANRRERLYEQALQEAREATEREPAPVVALHGAGKLHLALGRLGTAAALLDRALERASAERRTAPSVRAAAGFDRALVDLASFRADLALHRLERLAAPGSGIPEALRERLEAILADASAIAKGRSMVTLDGAHPGDGFAPSTIWQKAKPALETEAREGVAASLPRLLAFAEASPGDATLSLLAGRALLLSGRGSEALPLLRRAEASRRLPPFWVGPCSLMAGQAADLAGDRKLARVYYRRAQGAPWFPSRDAAFFHETVPYRGGP